MADKLTIPFDGRTEKDIEGDGEKTSISFSYLRKLLEPVVDCDEDEKIAGFLIDKDGITIKIETT